MNILRSFVIKQTLLALLGLIIVAALTFAVFGVYINQVSNHKASIVKLLLHSHVSTDPKLLARQLTKAYDFQSLNIMQLDGSGLYTDMSRPPSNTLSYQLFQMLEMLPKKQQVQNNDLNIKLMFELGMEIEFQFLDKLLITVLLSISVLTLLSLIFIKAGINRVLKKLSFTMVNLIESVVPNTEKKPAINWQRIPKSFSSVVDAIKNLSTSLDQQMTALKNSAQQVKTEASIDGLTGLPNRNRFIQFFEEQLRDQDNQNFGCLAVIRCAQLQEINHTRGYQEGDQYVKEVVGLIVKGASSIDKSVVYRLNGADFAVVMPAITLKQAEEFAQTLQTKFNEYQHTAEIESVAYTGLIGYKPGNPLGEMLALADTAISIAQTKKTNGWHSQKEVDINDNASASYGNQNWRHVIDDVIANKRVTLMHQTIQPCGNTRTYAEVLTRFKTAQEQILPTASFLAMAEKLDKIAEVDRMIIETTLELIKSQKLSDKYYGVNITPKTIQDQQFMLWLERCLQQDQQLTARLVFEVSEFGLQQNVKVSKRFIDLVHRAGARVTVERFGVGLTSFKFFRDLKPDFIKMDGTYTRGIDEDKNNQYFMRLMVDLAHRIGVGVFAEGVETQGEKAELERLYIDGVQGYFIGKPEQF